MGSTNRFAVGKAEGKRLLGRPRLTMEDQIKINQKVLYNGVGYILLAQNWHELQAFVKRVQKLQVLSEI
jgi:hypothetical protein